MAKERQIHHITINADEHGNRPSTKYLKSVLKTFKKAAKASKSKAKFVVTDSRVNVATLYSV